jgi:hypothetical protein
LRGAHLLAFGTLGPCGHAFDALGPLRPLGALLHPRRSAFGPLRPLLALGVLPAALLRPFDAVSTVVAARLRTGRGCDRQGGDARGEKYPGHHKISSRTAKTARS